MNPTPEIPHDSAPRSSAPTPHGWTKLPHEHLPPATFWPAGLALAIVFVFWGLISSWVILGVGIGLFVVALSGWITDLRNERKHHS